MVEEKQISRVLKFRAWDVKKSRMIYFNACKRWGFINHELEPETTASFGGSEIQLTTNPEHYILMQFTGLLDKAKIEVYEKDRDADGNMLDWCNQCCGYQFFMLDLETKDVICCHNCEGNFMLQDHIADFEIAGNFYESPELVR